MFIIYTVLLRELEAPEVHLKSLYGTIKDSVTVNSISQALQVHNEILRKRIRQKNDRVLSQLLSGSVTCCSLTQEQTMDAKGSVNSWPWNGSMGLAGLLFVTFFRAMLHVCPQLWADKMYGSAGEPGHIWLILLCFYYWWFSYLRVYFMDLYAVGILAHLEDFPVAQAVLVKAVEATENLSHFAIFFFYLF